MSPKTPVLVKICGITNENDALWAVNFGADFVGLNFVPESPRKISIEKAAEIAGTLPPFVRAAGVFVDPDPKQIEKILKKCPLRILQLHGNESPEQVSALKEQFHLPVWKAFRVENKESLSAIQAYSGIIDAVLLDAYQPDQMGGTGTTFDWALAVKAKESGIPLILSGGLTPDNVEEAVDEVEPYAVDTASGVEKDGHPRRKDADKMKKFIRQVKGI